MDILNIVIIFLVIIVSMTLHELMHGFVAYLLGDNTAKEQGRLTLNPLKHLDPVYSIALPLIMGILGGPIFGGAKPVPVDSRNLKWGVWGMALVALAGPLTNLLIAYVSFLCMTFIGPSDFARIFLSVNLGFACFNMIPIPPLDGSRILYALAPDGVRNVFDGIEKGMGTMLIYLLILVFGGVFSAVIYGMENGILTAFLWTVGM